jgi:hypothetical protein
MPEQYCDLQIVNLLSVSNMQQQESKHSTNRATDATIVAVFNKVDFYMFLSSMDN